MSDRRRTLSGGDLPTGVAEFTWYATKAVSNAILFNHTLNTSSIDGTTKPSEIFSAISVNGINIGIPTTDKDVTYSFPSAGYYKVRVKVINSTSSKIVSFPHVLFCNDNKYTPWALGDNSTYYCIKADLSGLVFDYTNGIAGFLPSFGTDNAPNTKLEHIIMPKVLWTVTKKSWPPSFNYCSALTKISNFKNIDCSGGFYSKSDHATPLVYGFVGCTSLRELIVENCDFSQGGFPTFYGTTPNLKKFVFKNCKLNYSGYDIPAPCDRSDLEKPTIPDILDYSGTSFPNISHIQGATSQRNFWAKHIYFNNCVFGNLKTIEILNSVTEELDFTNCNLSTVTSLRLSGTKLTKLVITGVFNPSSASIYDCPNVTLYYNNDTTYNYFKGKSVSSSWKYVKI